MSTAGRGIVLRQIDRLFGEGTLTGLGDGSLLERYLTRRDEDAFEALVDLHGPMVLGLCRRMLRDPRDIEDAFQATFLVLARKAPAIRDRDLLSSWLYGVAYRVARRARSRTLRRRERESAVGVPEVAAEPEAERAEIDPMLDQELSRLPERYRAPLVLCYLRGRTHEQAAEDLRCPVGTVRSRLARGRGLLRDRLTRRGFAPSVLGGLLGGDPAPPARLLVATVPPPMAAATVRAALGFGSSSIIKAGAAAASSAALARGVLSTMRIAQLKWIGLATMATCLSAGGVIAVGAATAQKPGVPTAGQPAEVTPPGGVQKKEETPTEKYIRETEQKIDQLLWEIGFYPSDNPRPGRPAGDGSLAQKVVRRKLGPLLNGSGAADVMTGARLKALEDKIDRLMGRSGTPTAEDSTAVLRAQLEEAIKRYERMNHLAEQGDVEGRLADEAGDRVRAIAARVEVLDQGTRDELEGLKLERRRKLAMLVKARAELEVATAIVARHRILNQRKPGMVDATEVAKAEGQFKVAAAQCQFAEVEVEEVDLRIQQLERRRAGLPDLVERAGRARTLK